MTNKQQIKERLEEQEQQLILRMLDLDERGSSEEYEAVREELVDVQVILEAMQ